MLLAFGAAILGAVGLHGLVRTARRIVLIGFGVLFAAAGLALFVVWLTGANRVQGFTRLGTASYWWVAGGILTGLALVGTGIIDLITRPVDASSQSTGVLLRTRWTSLRTWVACLLLALESAFLVVAGSTVWTVSLMEPKPHRGQAAATHRRIVGRRAGTL